MNNATIAPQTSNESRVQASPSQERGYLYPHVNIVESKDAWVLEAEMPGVNKDGLEIHLEDNQLTIVGRKQVATPQANLIYRESVNRDYKRVFELAPSIDSGRIHARINDGVLHLELPKADKVKPRKIAVE